ncbi:MAG: sigma 54-interacting transcriptional regulator [Chitinispirillaceae bacterium]|nr:sigma 54-interacting transcriptional regulator [Chitinispirillaceae bacterium]
MQLHVLFLDVDHTVSRVAEALSLQYIKDSITPDSAGLIPGELSDVLRSKLLNITGSGEIAEAKAVTNQIYDVVVTIGKNELFSVLPGVPPTLNWHFENSSEIDALVDEIDQKVKCLFSYGFINSLVRQRISFEHVFDSLREGIIVHDLKRKIFLVSRGAERITGISRETFIGRDCHTLFTPRLCGEECAFCNPDCDNSNIQRSEYTTLLTPVDGSRKELDVVRMPLKDEDGKVIGAIASFTDSTRVHKLEEELGEAHSFKGIIGRDYKMLAIYELIRDLAGSDFPVVVTGESGTGKELVAAAIHKESLRRDRLFVPVNCGALPEGTLESELFGHVKGSFTGAIRDKKGRFELADKGTLFLDEIGELSLPMQVKLLRVLQEGIFEPVGGEVPKNVDVRVICATNRNLKEMTARGQFREDLYYRLAVVPIEVPPLRERRNDIPLLANFFLDKITRKLGRGEMYFAEETMSVIMNYNWPGNVRQLQNAIQFALIKCHSHIINPEHLPPEVLSGTFVSFNIQKTPGKAGRKPKLTKDTVERALVKAGGNKAKAARLLGVGRATLYNFLNEHEEIAVAE